MDARSADHAPSNHRRVSCVVLVLVGGAGGYVYGSVHPLRGDNRHDGVRPRVPGDVSRDARCDALLADWMKGHPAP